MRTNTFFLAIVGLVLGLFAMLTPLHAEDDWTTQLLEPGTLKWAYDTQGTLVSAPAISDDGIIYVTSGANKRLYAIRPDGTVDWFFDGFGDYVFTVPAIADDGTIYVGCWDGNLYAINPWGTKKWDYKVGWRVDSPAIASDGTIYVSSNDYQLHAVRPGGIGKWVIEFSSYVGGYAIGSDGTIYVGCWDKKLYALNPDRSLKWQFGVTDSIHTSPAIGSDGTIYVGTLDKKLWAINPNGTGKWQLTFGDAVTCPAIGSDGTLYVGSKDNKLYAINPSGTGTIKWAFQAGSWVGNPAVGLDGTIYVGSYDNKIYAVSPSGTKKWEYTTGDDVLECPAIGSDGTLYVGSKDHKLYALSSDSRGLANSSWPVWHHDVKRTGQASFSAWGSAYKVLLDNQTDLSLLRQYRDAFLNKTAPGKLYTELLYKSSEEALEVLLNNPSLMLRARRLIEANKDAVAEVLDGNRGVIYNTDEIIYFLDAYAQESPASLRLLAITVKKEMLEKQEQGEPFLGFELH